MNKTGKLFLVPTPIGNLEDITFRAVRILKEADIILCEDTRTSSVLLNHYQITTKKISHHKFNEHQNTEKTIQLLEEGKSIALISDAGTPGISDPGYLLVKNCIEKNIHVETLPGASAILPALINSGLPNHEFLFVGFLPLKKGRETKIKQLSEEARTFILYESPYRVVKCLEQLLKFCGDRKASVSRELSKKFEETKRGSVSELILHFKNKAPKGEFVIVCEGKG